MKKHYRALLLIKDDISDFAEKNNRKKTQI